jgi:hypothetical protein
VPGASTRRWAWRPTSGLRDRQHSRRCQLHGSTTATQAAAAHRRHMRRSRASPRRFQIPIAVDISQRPAHLRHIVLSLLVNDEMKRDFALTVRRLSRPGALGADEKGLFMASLKKRTAIAVTASLWLAAAGSAAAFTYQLNRRLDPQPHGVETAGSLGGRAPASLAAQRMLYVPTLVIIAPWPHRLASVNMRAPSTPVAREISEMGCRRSRELDIGSGLVQFCD